MSPAQGETFRDVRVSGYGSFAPRVERMAAVRAFLEESGFGEAERIKLQGDASTRGYERLVLDGQSYILMNSPRRPDGPPVRDGKPYSAIAHLAEDVNAFIAMAKGLRQRGLSAPTIYFADSEKGFLILEDLGEERLLEGEPPAPVAERYETAVDLLAALHSNDLPPALPVSPRVDHRIPTYDLEAFLIEAELLLDWYLPRLKAPVAQEARDAFLALWQDALTPVLEAPATWVLRDYHSPNILWLPEREGIARVGLLDFQDAVLGTAAYDLASLLQDARVDVHEGMEITLLGRYARLRREATEDFDTAALVRLYATVAAQRATKILGIFARLDMRDGKPQYLRHMPRISGYLQRSLAHPALEPLRTWYATHVPALKTL
jgi:aminoglycoside/choline kinase family phosphotransferase